MSGTCVGISRTMINRKLPKYDFRNTSFHVKALYPMETVASKCSKIERDPLKYK